MSQSFTDNVILITGAASGIGRATSIKLSSLGAILALCDINASDLAQVVSLCQGSGHITAAFNVSSSFACNDFINLTISKLSKIDHVFNCAGVNPTSLVTANVTDEYWDKILNTNLKGIFNITRACVPYLHPGATFVNMSSICGLQPTPGFAVYCASKYGVIGFSKCMALELGPKNIRTNVVAPGYIDTPTNASVVTGKEAVHSMESNISMGRFGTVDEVADIVLFLMSEASRYMNGSVVEVSGGML